MAQRIEVPGAGILEFPDEMTDEQMAAAIQSNFPDLHKPATAPQPQAAQSTQGGPTSRQKIQASLPMRIIQGMRDPIDAGAQLLPHALSYAASLGGAYPNVVSNFLGSEAQRVDKMVSDAEKEYQAARRATYQPSLSDLVTGNTDPGWDIGRITGNVLSPANFAIASRVPIAATFGGKVLQGGLLGGGYGALSPVTDLGPDETFAERKAKQIGLGAVTGAIVPAIASGIARVIRPNTSKEVTALMKEGVTPTIGQTLGGRAQRAEEGLTSVPILGDAIKSAQRRTVEQFNRATLNKALSPIGEKLPKDVHVGNDAIEYVAQKLGDKYDDLLPKMVGRADDAFTSELSTLRQMAQNLPAAQRAHFDRILQNEVEKRFTPHGLMSGETAKNIESKLGQMIRGYGKDANYDNQLLADALRETQATLRRMLERNNPQFAGELQNINAGYAAFLRAQNAAGRIGSHEGVFSPAALRGAVRQLDPSRNKAAFARGNALLQDLADAGQSVLGSRVPDSGTPFRIANMIALGGGYMVNPGVPAGIGAASLLYSSPAQRFANMLLTQRPAFAQPVAEAVRKFAPFATPGLLPFAQESTGLLN